LILSKRIHVEREAQERHHHDVELIEATERAAQSFEPANQAPDSSAPHWFPCLIEHHL